MRRSRGDRPTERLGGTPRPTGRWRSRGTRDPTATVAVTRTKKSIHTLLLSANGTEPGMYRNEINCEVTLDALFA